MSDANDGSEIIEVHASRPLNTTWREMRRRLLDQYDAAVRDNVREEIRDEVRWALALARIP